MRSYGQYCPVARAAEVLGDRWTVLIVREMSFGVHHFNELERCLPGISRSVLAQRLRHLEHVGLISRTLRPDGRVLEYRLTEAGDGLRPVLRALGDWAARWAFGEPDPAQLDPDLLVRWISRHVDNTALPSRRVVVRFTFAAPTPRTYWMVLDHEEVSVCLHDPGFDTDVHVTADVAALYDVYLGRRTLSAAMAADLVRLGGLPTMVRAFPHWFTWSDFAPAVRSAHRPVTAGTR
jgi:DNA-binding HxlR family transcriptional regulator